MDNIQHVSTGSSASRISRAPMTIGDETWHRTDADDSSTAVEQNGSVTKEKQGKNRDQAILLVESRTNRALLVDS